MLNQHNATTKVSTNHNCTPLNNVLEHVCLNSRPPPSIVCTSAKGTSHGENDTLRYDAQSLGAHFHVIQNLSTAVF